MNEQSESSPHIGQAPMPIQTFYRFPALPTEIKRLIIEALWGEDDTSTYDPIPTDLKARLHKVEADGHKFNSARSVQNMGTEAVRTLFQLIVLKARNMELVKLIMLNVSDIDA
ncbi:hypothetical protein Landi51_09362 [Colletotrichum acutatum]